MRVCETLSVSAILANNQQLLLYFINLPLIIVAKVTKAAYFLNYKIRNLRNLPYFILNLFVAVKIHFHF